MHTDALLILSDLPPKQILYRIQVLKNYLLASIKISFLEINMLPHREILDLNYGFQVTAIGFQFLDLTLKQLSFDPGQIVLL